MKRHLVLATTAVTFFAAATAAQAGEYQVKACYSAPGLGITHLNASWHAEPTTYAAAYDDACDREGMVTRMSGGAGRAPLGVGGRTVFTAPPGTRVSHLHADVLIGQSHGWAAGIGDATPRWILCGSGPCWYAPGIPQGWGAVDLAVDSPQVFAQVSCGDTQGCPRNALYAQVLMKNVVVTVRDDTPPSVQITGGSATSDQWQQGPMTVSYAASDASGIRNVTFRLDGADAGGDRGSCWDGYARPCSDAAGSSPVPIAGASDGAHVLSIEAQDAAGNVHAAERSVFIDRTAPRVPQNAHTVGPRWRAENDFAGIWDSPPTTAAPIVAAHYRFCPASNKPGELDACGQEQRVGIRNVSTLTHLKAPKEGDWRLLLWLEDAAGNTDPTSVAAVVDLGLDESAPELVVSKLNPDDPARVRVAASDEVSGIAAGQIEVRKRGENAWRALRTVLDTHGFSAVMDDEKLPRGTYEIRAHAVDRAGNERTTDGEEGGEPAIRTLPLRIRTRLVVGRPTRVRARGSHGRKRYRTVLVVKPRASYGRTIPLRGRLTTPGGNPLANVNIEVSQRTKLPTAQWHRIAIVRTNRTGRFRFKALRGPSRALRFRYRGTAKISSRTTEVDLRIRAQTTIKASRLSVVNGEDVTFSGRVKGRQFGSVGKLVYLQVYTRGRWATFATPRAGVSSGRWHEDYRFTATRGLVHYRFRAVVPREAGYPYERGKSHSVRVTVRGL